MKYWILSQNLKIVIYGKIKEELTIPSTTITTIATAIKMPATIPESTSSVCKTVPSVIELLPDGRIVAVNK